jgi:predicted TIM-barrel fold metal-dependent hydrolase
MKLGRFIVDTHVHSQRHATGAAMKGSKDYAMLSTVMGEVDAYDNSARLIYDMDCYGVDMCIVEPAFGMSNEIDVEQMKKYPQRFACNAQAGTKHTRDRVARGEIKWSLQAALDELEALLKTGNYVGIGEGMPRARLGGMEDKSEGKYPEYTDELTLVKEMMEVCDLARKYKVPVRYHSGLPGGYAISYHGFPTTFNPLWAHDLAIAFPDVPLILEHSGIEGGWWEHFYEQCLHVAAGHKNVFLETGRWWTDLYYKALQDPGVGPEKLIWGTDWGASLPVYQYPAPGSHGYTRQNVKEGIPRHQVDIWGWSLRQIARLDITQDDMNLILGGNAVRLYNLRTPGGLTRMFKFVD